MMPPARQGATAGEDEGEYTADRRVIETRPVGQNLPITGGLLHHTRRPEPSQSTTLCSELPVLLSQPETVAEKKPCRNVPAR